MTSYQPNIPTGLVNLDVDYQNLRGNFQQTDTTYSVDHIPLTQVANNGYHTNVHLVPPSTTVTNPPDNYPATMPAVSAGIGLLCSPEINDGNATDTALYFQSGAGVVHQLTSNITPKASTNGYTYLPGGIILQWGLVTPMLLSGNVVFLAAGNIDFSSSIFSVVATLGPSSPAATSNGTVSIYNTSTTGFSYTFTGSGYNRFRWIAIGK